MSSDFVILVHMVALNKSKAKKEVEFLCTECGNTTPKWAGKCPFCGAWSSLKEHVVENILEGGRASRGLGGPVHKVVPLKDVATEDDVAGESLHCKHRPRI